VIKSVPVIRGWDTEDERDILGWETLPGAWRIQTTYLIPWPWGPTPGRQVPLRGLKTSITYKTAQKNWDSTHEEHVHIRAYSWEQGRGSKWRLPRALVSFSRGPHFVRPHPWPAPTSLALVLLPLWDEAAPSRRGENSHWEEMEPAQTQPSGFLLQHLRTQPHPKQGNNDHWVEEKVWLTLGPGPDPSISSPVSHQGDSCQHAQGEDMTCAHCRSSSPTKAWHMQTAYGCSHIRTRNNAICSNTNGPRDYHIKWRKSGRERHIWYHFYVESKKKKMQINLFTKQKQTHRLWKETNGYQSWKTGGRDKSTYIHYYV